MKINYNYLINIKFCKHLLLVIIIILSIFMMYAYNKKTYDVFTTYLIYENNTILINASINNSDAVEKGKFIKVDNKYYNYKIDSKSEMLINNESNYYEYKLIIKNLNFKYNEIKQVTFYYNYEKLLKKIAKIII